jgi:hypothetical protein
VFFPSYSSKDTFFLAFTKAECTEVHAMAPLTLRRGPLGRSLGGIRCQVGNGEEKKSLTAGMPNVVVQLTALSLYWSVFGGNGICFLF